METNDFEVGDIVKVVIKPNFTGKFHDAIKPGRMMRVTKCTSYDVKCYPLSPTELDINGIEEGYGIRPEKLMKIT